MRAFLTISGEAHEHQVNDPSGERIATCKCTTPNKKSDCIEDAFLAKAKIHLTMFRGTGSPILDYNCGKKKVKRCIDVGEKRQLALPTPTVVILCTRLLHSFICSQSENHIEKARKRARLKNEI